MRDAERSGKKLDEKQKAAVEELDRLLVTRFASGHFKEEDTLRTHMDRYADLAIFYAARLGREKVLEKLLADGPYPEGKRAHHKRGSDLEALADEDWRWLRVSIHAYSFFFNEALDRSKPPEERRPTDAVRILAALERALPKIRKQGALGGLEFSILAMRVRRDAITKNWEGMEKTFQLMKKRNWGRLYRLVSLSLGETSAYMTAEEFEARFKKFCEQEPPLPHYLRVAYEALRNKRYRAALTAARITAERFPDNEEVQKEYRLLRELIRRRDPGALKPPAPAPEEKARPEAAPAPAGAGAAR
jgi:hypothetical protein